MPPGWYSAGNWPPKTWVVQVYCGARSYRGIRECNYALSVLPKLTMSAGHKARIEGELKFIRAFRYQDLIRNYGGIVLMGDKVNQPER
jgi:hypothetical protein